MIDELRKGCIEGLFKFWEMADSISEMVQDRDIIVMED